MKNTNNQKKLVALICTGLSYAVLVSGLLALSACSSVNENPGEAQELPINGEDISESQEELFKLGVELYQGGIYSIALNNFDALKNSYPTGPYREFAELKAADCYVMQRDFASAGQRFDQFAKDHPSSKSLDYALFMYARSLQLQNTGAGRNMGALEQSITAYQDFVKNFPNSVYHTAAQAHLHRAVETRHQHDLNVSDFYANRAADPAANARYKIASTRQKEISTSKPMLKEIKSAAQLSAYQTK